MSTKFRADAVEDLMNQVRQHWDHLDQVHGTPGQDDFSRAPAASPQAPAHSKIDLSKAYDFNMVAAQFATVEAFGRKRNERPVVKSSESAALRQRLPPQTTFGHAGLAPPKKAAANKVPQWLRSEVAYEEAIRMIEERALKAARDPLTRTTPGPGKPAPPPQAPVASASGPHPDDGVDADNPVPSASAGEDVFDRPPAPAGPDMTNPNFEYKPGDSFFESLSAGAKIVSGQGADFTDPEGTVTFFGRSP